MTISRSESWIIMVCLALVMYLLFRQSFRPGILVSVAIGAAVALICALVVKKISRDRGNRTEAS